MLSKAKSYLVILFSIVLFSFAMVSAESKPKKITPAQLKKYQTSEYIWSTDIKKGRQVRIEAVGRSFTIESINSNKLKKNDVCIIRVSALKAEISKQYKSPDDIKFAKPKYIKARFGWQDYPYIMPTDDGGLTEVVIRLCLAPGGNDCEVVVKL